MTIESHVNEGPQDISPEPPLQHCVSVTDACISFDQTVLVLTGLATAVRARPHNSISAVAKCHSFTAQVQSRSESPSLYLSLFRVLGGGRQSGLGFRAQFFSPDHGGALSVFLVGVLPFALAPRAKPQHVG